MHHLRLWSTLAVTAVLAASGCEGRRQAPPVGTHLVADAATIGRLLPHLARMQQAPATQAAARARENVSACTGTVYGSGDGFLEALEALRCMPAPADVLAVVRPGPKQLGVVRPLAAMGTGFGVLDVDDAGNVSGRLRLYEPPGAAGAARMLVPATTGPGPAVLSSSALIHFRVRARDGIDIAALAGGGGQGADLFALDSQLFSSAILDGTWEFGLYPSTPQNVFPPAALVVGLRSRALGEKAASEFVGALRSRWPIDEVKKQWGDNSGGCFPTLHILPRLAPCYAFVGDNLVVAWNEAALMTSTKAPDDPGKSSFWHVAAGAFGESDKLITLVRRKGVPPEALPVPWNVMDVEGGGDGDGVWFDVRLTDAGSAG